MGSLHLARLPLWVVHTRVPMPKGPTSNLVEEKAIVVGIGNDLAPLKINHPK